MNRAEIEQKIIEIIHEQKTLAEDAIKPNTPLRDAGIDSLDALNILFQIEETFGITIPDDRARQVQTVNDIVTAVQELHVG